MIDFKKLVEARVHFGHKTDRWFPLMKPYIWGAKNKVHLIDVSKTAFQMEKAAKFLESVAADGKQILWVGTKRPAQETIVRIGKELKMPYVNHRWVGGTLTNFPQVKRSVTKMMHFEDVLSKAEKFPFYTKKELSVMKKNLERLQTNVDGIRNLKHPVGVVVVVDVTKEATAVKEAAKSGIPVVALVDTNGDPSMVDYVIPGNDDAPRSIAIVLDYLASGVKRGLEVVRAAKNEAVAAKEQKAKAAVAQEKKAPAKKPVEQEAKKAPVKKPAAKPATEEKKAAKTTGAKAPEGAEKAPKKDTAKKS